MCGRLNITDDLFVQGLLKSLQVDLTTQHIKANRFVRAASTVQIVKEIDGQRKLHDAIWWLLLEQTDTGYKPSKYTSFNTRYDKLNVPRTAGYLPFRQSRCIIPARGFGETEFVQQGTKKVPKHYVDFIACDSAIAFGGLYKEYIHPTTGEVITGCSIITLPPHEKIRHLHAKASPLMLPQDHTVDDWLNPKITDVALFDWLLTPAIRQSLQAIPIDKPSSYQAIGQPITINAD